MNSNTRKRTNFNFTQFMWTKTNLRSKRLRSFPREFCCRSLLSSVPTFTKNSR